MATSTTAAALAFHQIWHIGRRVIAPPHRAGTVIAVQGVGPGAIIIVRFDGGATGSFSPGQLT